MLGPESNIGTAATPPGLISIEALGADGVLSLLRRSAAIRLDVDHPRPLEGLSLINAFFESSTRTRVSFESAAIRLGARVIGFSGDGSSLAKGETLADTVRTLDAMGPDFLVVRHRDAGVMPTIARHTRASVLNAGDGRHQHPTQALLDMLTIAERHGRSLEVRQASDVLDGVEIAIVGDVLHSRVARSTAQAALLLGARVTLVGPVAMCPAEAVAIGDGFGYPIRIARAREFQKVMGRVDVAYFLRIQLERQLSGVVFPSLGEYARLYRLDGAGMDAMKAGAIVMHPGPVNHGVELAGEVVDDPVRSAILEQVANGVRVRMASLLALHEARRGREG